MPTPKSESPSMQEIRALAERMKHLTPAEVNAWLAEKRAFTILDVRSSGEYMAYHIPGSRHVPMEDLPSRVAELDPKDGPFVVHCEHGFRSLDATLYLMWNGVPEVYNMQEGISGWPGPIEHGLGQSG